MRLGPIEASLCEILAQDASDHLILIGGAAILVRRAWLELANAKTLIEAVPAARTTEDLDFALGLDVFFKREDGQRVRSMLDALDYKPSVEFWQFEKEDITIDFLARIPEAGKGVKWDNLRVGARPSIRCSGTRLRKRWASSSCDQDLGGDACRPWT